MKRKATLSLMTLSIFGIGFLCGQITKEDVSAVEPIDVKKQLAQASANANLYGMSRAIGDEGEIKKYASGPQQLSNVYYANALNPNFSKHVLAIAIGEWETGKAKAQSAPQISQAADEVRVDLEMLQTAQNARIIELLQQIKAKK